MNKKIVSLMKFHHSFLIISTCAFITALFSCNGNSDNLYVSGQVGDISFETGNQHQTVATENEPIEIVSIRYQTSEGMKQFELIETDANHQNKYHVGETVQIKTTPERLSEKQTYISSELHIIQGR